MTDKPKRKPFHEEFAEKIIESLQAGTAPWQRPWHPGVHLTPHNPVSGTVYKGVNRISLSMCGHDDPRWMTFKQANDQGMSIMSGSKSRPVVYYQFTKEEDRLDEDGKPVLGEDGKVLKKTVELERPIMRFISVFNAEQIKGMPPLQLTDKPFEWDPVEKAEGILAASGAVIKHDQSDRAFYRPSTDSIHLPPRANFEDAGKYYSTAIHELGHWTGHSSRLDRGFEPFGEGYAREELRAEIASWMLGQDIGIGHDPGQHAAYVASWIKALKDDPFEIMRACRDAESIKEYVMGFGLERQVEQQLARDRELDGHGLEGPEDIAHEHAAAMYRSQAETVEEFVNSIPQHGNIQKSVFHLRSVNGNPVELATDQVRHIRSHHPDFNEWERIPDIVEHGRTIPVGIDKFTNSPTKIYILEEGDKSFVVIGASVSGSQRKEGHIARTVTLTAFHDDTTKVLHWASRHEKENALSPSDVNQTTSRADGYSSLPRSADAEHPTNLFRDGVPVSINELDEEVNGFLQERTKERAITYSSAGRTPASSPAREGAALSNLSDGLEKKLKTFDEEVNEILGRTRDEEKTFLAHEHAAAMYKAEDPSISDFARRVGQEEKQHKSYFGLMPDQGVFSGIEVILPSDSVKHRDKRHPDMTDQDMDRLSQVLAALTPEQACLPQNDVPRFSGKGILAWAVVNGQAYGLILESVSPERVIIASYFKDHENTVRAWFEQEGDIKKAVMTPAALWPAQASKEDVLHDQPSEERIAEPPVEVKANLGAAKEKT
ncbi:MAG: ssDNA-binding domain-containing protein, partial [Deltaproteobacteria bacterium]|nr:ssDNA-binding domain-containing protein [Deltaproteobacteria bacterium]